MRAKIINTDEAAEYLTDERCHILELSNAAGDPGASIARARVEPGIGTKRHRVIDTVERYLIVEGHGKIHVEGLSDECVGPGDVVIIPPGAEQAITNTGDHDLVFLCICTPRFEWDNYQSLE